MKKIELKDGQGNRVQVSCIALGTARSMNELMPEERFKIIDRYLELGGNCIDTARAYNGGKSEPLVGEYFKSRGNRDKFVISTKGCNNAPDGSSRLTLKDMQEDLDKSLKALETDYIDIYWIHKDDPDRPVEKIIDDVNTLKKTGKIGLIGCSNWTVDRIEAANKYAEESGQEGFFSSQIQWSIAATEQKYFDKYTSRVMDGKSYKWYLENNMPVFAFSPQAQGFFTKLLNDGEGALNDEMRNAYYTEENVERFRRIKLYAEERDLPISSVVISCLIHNKLICIPIFGARTIEMVNESMAAADIIMTEKEADNFYNI